MNGGGGEVVLHIQHIETDKLGTWEKHPTTMWDIENCKRKFTFERCRSIFPPTKAIKFSYLYINRTTRKSRSRWWIEASSFWGPFLCVAQKNTRDECEIKLCQHEREFELSIDLCNMRHEEKRLSRRTKVKIVQNSLQIAKFVLICTHEKMKIGKYFVQMARSRRKVQIKKIFWQIAIRNLLCLFFIFSHSTVFPFRLSRRNFHIKLL